MKFSEFIIHQNFLNFPLYFSQNKSPNAKLWLQDMKLTESSRVKQYEKKNFRSIKKKQLKQHERIINKSERIMLIQRTKNLFEEPKSQRLEKLDERRRNSLDFKKKRNVHSSADRYSVHDPDDQSHSLNLNQRPKGRDFLGSAIYRTVIRIPEAKSRNSPQNRCLQSQQNRKRPYLKRSEDKSIYRRRPNTMQNTNKQKHNRNNSEVLEPW